MNGTIKQNVGKTAIGLNVAAIVFLYTTFTPQKQFDKLENKYILTQEEVIMLKVGMKSLMNIENKKWE